MLKYGGWLIILYSVLLGILILLDVIPTEYSAPIWFVGTIILLLPILRAIKKKKELESRGEKESE